MSNRRFIGLAIIGGILLILLLIWLKPDNLFAKPTIVNQATASSTLSSAIAPLPVLSNKEIQQRVKQAISRRQFVRLDESKLHQGVVKSSLFQPSDAKTVVEINPIKLTEAQQQDGRAFINYDLYTLEGKIVGDRIQFYVPEVGLNRTAIVDQVKVDPQDDIISWSGHLENGDQNNEDFYISQTIKDNYAIGSVTTIDGGVYSLETKNGVGWISNRPDASSIHNHDDGIHDHEDSPTTEPKH